MLPLTLALAVVAPATDTITLLERIDVYDPVSGAHISTERTWFGPDGRRVRWEIFDAAGDPTLLFYIHHDDHGREADAVYFEGGSTDPTREVFTYTPDGRTRITTYYYDPGVAGDRMESFLDDRGREIGKSFYRADGSQYGAEDVLWNPDGTQLGWDFRYVDREGSTSFRYVYDAYDADGAWSRRVRLRNGEPERVEVRERVTQPGAREPAEGAVFMPGIISSEAAETSPSFTADGRTMVFARYGDDWEHKEPFIAELGDGGWEVRPLDGIGPVYNLAIAPDAHTVIFARAAGDARSLHRIRRDGDGWSAPEDLTAAYGLVGAYPSVTAAGDLLLFDGRGPGGPGIYRAPRDGDGFAQAQALYTPEGDGTTFDAIALDDETLLVARCLDDVCASDGRNGIWRVPLAGDGSEAGPLPRTPYAWGVQPVPALGLLVFTDGNDILTIPWIDSGAAR